MQIVSNFSSRKITCLVFHDPQVQDVVDARFPNGSWYSYDVSKAIPDSNSYLNALRDGIDKDPEFSVGEWFTLYFEKDFNVSYTRLSMDQCDELETPYQNHLSDQENK